MKISIFLLRTPTFDEKVLDVVIFLRISGWAGFSHDGDLLF